MSNQTGLFAQESGFMPMIDEEIVSATTSMALDYAIKADRSQPQLKIDILTHGILLICSLRRLVGDRMRSYSIKCLIIDHYFIRNALIEQES